MQGQWIWVSIKKILFLYWHWIIQNLLTFYHHFLTFVYLFGGLQCFWNAFTNRHQLRISTSPIMTFHAQRRVHVNQCHYYLLASLVPSPPFNHFSKPFNLQSPLVFVSFCDSGSHCLNWVGNLLVHWNTCTWPAVFILLSVKSLQENIFVLSHNNIISLLLLLGFVPKRKKLLISVLPAKRDKTFRMGQCIYYIWITERNSQPFRSYDSI